MRGEVTYQCSVRMAGRGSGLEVSSTSTAPRLGVLMGSCCRYGIGSVVMKPQILQETVTDTECYTFLVFLGTWCQGLCAGGHSLVDNMDIFLPWPRKKDEEKKSVDSILGLETFILAFYIK